MKVEGNSLVNIGDNVVCWEGQVGGLEGLRQKGWSLISLLVIAREAQKRNIDISTLASGDNQVILAHFDPPITSNNEDEIVKTLESVVYQNNLLMS